MDITDYSQKALSENFRNLLDGKHDDRALDGKSLAQDVRSLDAAKQRLKALLYIVGPITGETLYNLAADEIECLRAQVEDHIANALARANKQAIMVEALKHIREMSIYHTDREIATKVLVDVGELQP